MPYNKRINIIFFAIFLAVTFLTGKILFLQIFYHNEYYKEAASQRITSVKISNNRGIIYDRNLIPLVGNNPVKYAVVFPEHLTKETQIISLLKKATGQDLTHKLTQKKPFAQELNNYNTAILKKLSESNMLIFDDYKRYGDKNLARHVIGYVSPVDEHGKSGIEKMYDNYLYSRRGKYIGIISNALQNSIGSFSPRYINQKEFEGEFDVKLTLDYHIQKVIEQELDSSGVTGAVVAIKVSNGDVVAMASRPQFKQDEIKKYLSTKGTELIDRTIRPYNVGSIFKIVTAAAALESGTALPTDQFNCSGHKEIEGHSFRCAKVHGVLNMMSAFAVSCNSSFIEIGIRTGKSAILDMAKKMGLGQITNLSRQGFDESIGRLPDTKYSSNKEIANISIGQGEVMATPVQIAQLVSIVANDGIKNDINLVDSIIDTDGNVIKQIKTSKSERVLSVGTAEKLKEMMEMVTEKGTGVKANIPQFGGSAGKTGTAQTGWMNDDKTTKVHGWFAGYFPRENPEYAVVVLVENGKSGSNAAAPLFGKIASGIMKLGKR